MIYRCAVSDRVTISVDVAAAMRNARRAQGLPARSVGDHLGVTASWISAVERGQGRSIERQMLLDWLDLLELEPAELGIEVNPPRSQWMMPDSLEHVPQPDRVQAERFLEWVFRVRDAYR